jgi:CubicO group peptidase (beta-lactamase class C family)
MTARRVSRWSPITIRDLLTHTSGLSGESPHPSLAGVYDDLEVDDQPMSEMARRLAGHPLAHQPGASWIYGWSHGVLGHVIERITDRPLDVHLAEAVFEPLGMVDTGYDVPADKLDRVAVVYDQVDGGLRPRFDAETDVRTPPALLSGGTGCVSTIGDYRRFLRMLERGGELDGVRLLSPESVAAMTTNQLEPSLVPITIDDHVFTDEGFGLGVGVVVGLGATSPVGAPGTWTWAGAWGTTFCVDPSAGLTFVFLTQYEPWAWFREGAEYWATVRGSTQD